MRAMRWQVLVAAAAVVVLVVVMILYLPKLVVQPNERGSLWVITDPPVPAAISIDGASRGSWGIWADLPTGSHRVCFGSTANYIAPSCETVVIAGGNLTHVTGKYTRTGRLRVTTSPALPTQILVNGMPMGGWGLDWPDLAPGTYTVSFTHVEGYTEPAPQTVEVTSGNTTVVQGSFTRRGSLRVVTRPAVPGTITVDGVPGNNWGTWTDLPTGQHTVCFGPVPERTAPPCQRITINPGATTVVTGTYK
jgi:hypothetical protein